jgi:hypothetical protein
MLRRIGYGLGLLFVLACALAYPLTWERVTFASYDRGVGRLSPRGSAHCGHVMIGVCHTSRNAFDWTRRGTGYYRWTEPSPVARHHLYKVEFRREWIDDGVGIMAFTLYEITMPLWMPALAMSLFMAWRWRRRRRRRAARGFAAALPPS